MAKTRKLLEVFEENGEVVTKINCNFKELFSVLIHLVTQLSASTKGEISYNEILDDLKLVQKEEK